MYGNISIAITSQLKLGVAITLWLLSSRGMYGTISIAITSQLKLGVAITLWLLSSHDYLSLDLSLTQSCH